MSSSASATQLEATLHAHLPAALEFLRRLVEVNSYSINAAGVNENARLIAEQFAPLEFEVHQVPCAAPDSGSHLMLDNGSEGPCVALISHLDTVFSPAEEAAQDFRWRPEGDRIYGPGTVDIKGGTALIWLMMSALREVEPQLFGATRWVGLWNASEERRAYNFTELCQQTLPADTRACLVFEAGAVNAPDFNLIVARKGSGQFRVSVAGRAAHSGSQYEQGANAIHQLARVIDRVMALTNLERGTTVNVGVVRGGTVNNRVPHEAEASVEVRAFDFDHFGEVRDAILAMSGEGDVSAPSDDYLCRIKATLERQNAPWPRNAATQKLLGIWQEAGAPLGWRVHGLDRGGLSDANRLGPLFPTLDGLGPSGGNLHVSERSDDGTKQPEFVLPASLVPKALLNCLALKQLLENEGNSNLTATDRN